MEVITDCIVLVTDILSITSQQFLNRQQVFPKIKQLDLITKKWKTRTVVDKEEEKVVDKEVGWKVVDKEKENDLT